MYRTACPLRGPKSMAGKTNASPAGAGSQRKKTNNAFLFGTKGTAKCQTGYAVPTHLLKLSLRSGNITLQLTSSNLQHLRSFLWTPRHRIREGGPFVLGNEPEEEIFGYPSVQQIRTHFLRRNQLDFQRHRPVRSNSGFPWEPTAFCARGLCNGICATGTRLRRLCKTRRSQTLPVQES